MRSELSPAIWEDLRTRLTGELRYDRAALALYATDASAYEEIPAAVAFPASSDDVRSLIVFAREQKLSLIPRTAGTSLAGQVVGPGIVVDISRHMREVLEINASEGWVRVQPGVIRDELNQILQPHKCFFAPETSTSNRAMIGGMIGNNSCGANSITYGSTREHVLSLKAFLSDGSPVEIGELDTAALSEKIASAPSMLERGIYQRLQHLLSDERNQASIRAGYPKPSIKRRNTGYALDLLLERRPFSPTGAPFSLVPLIAGSEGTLLFITEATLRLSPLPKPKRAILCAHFNSVGESLAANIIAVRHRPASSELMDRFILEGAARNREQEQNRFFLQGDPEAVLCVEFRADSDNELKQQAAVLEEELRGQGLGYAYPTVYGSDVARVFALRKAGLGVLTNVPGDAKPVSVIEDTAVDVEDLPAFIAEFNAMLRTLGLSSVHYGHAGTGELHLRPVLDLKTDEGRSLFRNVAEEVAALVKRFHGSLSGEHGDGRLRGEFIPLVLGQENYQLLCRVKEIFDPRGIFNPGKITATPAMDQALRYRSVATGISSSGFHFRGPGSMLSAAEQCNGSGDCRKTPKSGGGVMCPSYMATLDEQHATRGRANLLRQFLTRTPLSPWVEEEDVLAALELCLSCKGCRSECPSNVDMAKLKAEFLQQHYKGHGIPLRSWLIAHFPDSMRQAARFPALANALMTMPIVSSLMKRLLGFAGERELPALAPQTLGAWFAARPPVVNATRRVVLFCDEFTNYNDVAVGQKLVMLLERCQVQVVMPTVEASGITFISKGLTEEAARRAGRNVALLHPLVSAETPLVGIEPSAILTVRDSYPDLVCEELLVQASELAAHTMLFDEYLLCLTGDNVLRADMFTREEREILLHGHCHQKALGSVEATRKVLSILPGATVKSLPTGCCGMAGSFGYEQEHYALSQAVGELSLFPLLRAAPESSTVAAPGTSCRAQITGSLGRAAHHPIEILFDALR